MADIEVLKEIEAAISAALAKRGIAGKIVVRGQVAELHDAGPVIAIELGEWVEQWTLLPPDMRDRRTEATAVRLQSAKTGSTRPAAQKRREPVPVFTLVLCLVGLAGLVGGGYWLRQANFFGKPESPAETAGSAGSVKTAAGDPHRKERLCEAARKRLYAGASMGVDTDGWIVELWLARDQAKGDLEADGKLQRAFDKGRVAAGIHPRIDALEHGQASLLKADETSGLSAVLVRFSEAYVTAFFDKQGRQHFEELAERLATASAADYAALFGRCAHLPVRDIGAWYRGRSETSAVAAMLYSTGLYSQPPALDKQLLAQGETSPLGVLEEKLRTLDAEVLTDELKKAGGKVRVADQAVSLHFPLGGPTRPSLATRSLATRLKLR